MKIEFASKAPLTSRHALERLLFFHPAQHTVADHIIRSVERFGPPRIVETPDGLTVQLGDRQVQTLFAFDRDQPRDEPFAVAIYTRTNREEISVAHVAVHPDYCLRSRRAGLGLGVMLIRQIRQIATRISGVERVEFSYLQRTVAVPRARQPAFARAV